MKPGRSSFEYRINADKNTLWYLHEKGHDAQAQTFFWGWDLIFWDMILRYVLGAFGFMFMLYGAFIYSALFFSLSFVYSIFIEVDAWLYALRQIGFRFK